MQIRPTFYLICFFVAASNLVDGQPKPLPYLDSSLPLERRVDDLVSRMTLEEKVSQLMNDSPAIPRLNVPAYNWWSEGLHGVARSGYATLFPQAIGMAATWDAPRMKQVGEAISSEARAKYNEAVRHDIHSAYYGLTIWSPNINIFRDPRWGRGQETYGEDPYLTSRLGVSFVQGMQGDDPNYFRVIATPKHYAVHSGPELDRHRFDAEPSAYDLWDTYLPAFRATVTEGKAYSLMCAYNALYHTPACANQEYLRNVLRNEWGFKGFVTSDCGAIDDFYRGHHSSANPEDASVAGIRAGTDTNCGDTYHALTTAVRDHRIEESEIDVSVRRLFTARFKLGLFDPEEMVKYAKIPYSEVESASHRKLAHEMSKESMVLLKNEYNTLPLKSNVGTIAVVGPNAASLAAIEGNYNAIPREPLLPVDGVAREFGSAKVLYAQGSPYVEGEPLPVPRTILHTDMSSSVLGLKGEYFADNELDGTPAATRIDPQVDFDWNSASPVAGLPVEHFSARWTGTIEVPEAGEYGFAVHVASCCDAHESFSLYVDGVLVAGRGVPEASNGVGTDNMHFNLHFDDTKLHSLKLEYRHRSGLYDAGIALQWAPKAVSLRQEALNLARQSDVILAFVGLSPDLEGEEKPEQIEGFSGGDRTDMQLPKVQQQLLESLSATGKPLVVVLLNGSALSVNWAQQHAQAILEAWYPGEGGAQAIAETLDGKNDPAGRLPVTFYSSIDQLPQFSDYSMKGRTYRYFKGKPLYEFGYGLSYTRFSYSKIEQSASKIHAGDELMVEADVQNIGPVSGDEVVQMYLLPEEGQMQSILELRGFERLHLASGERRRVRFVLDPRGMSRVDSNGARAVAPGRYRIAVGGSQPASDRNGLTAEFEVEGNLELPR